MNEEIDHEELQSNCENVKESTPAEESLDLTGPVE